MNQENRPIRSYVLRQGRISKAQQTAFETLMPKYGLAFQRGFLALDEVFVRQAPKILEIGFGMGDSTARMALENPEKDYLAIEVHTPGVGSLLKLVEEKHLSNVRIIQHDAVEVLENMIPDGSLSGAHIFFPDPWPKKRHHKRRLIQSELIGLLCRKLEIGGYIHAATDWEEYAAHILNVLEKEPMLSNSAAGYSERPAYRPLTKFEERGIRLGHGVRDIIFKKIRAGK
ncbi:MAG TPA: tRNA (guanosine(46)-N7)-methyltransferase TrmB [Burkholderiales bacterium]|nr:tRNA (guanosine(46)-N7)-methyltransferase TrmB [Burkholderiales bacterium]